MVDRSHRKAVYGAINRRLPSAYPVSTVQIDAEAISPAAGAARR
jgi:hypothetical protein